MNKTDLVTVGAVAFAVYAVWQIRKPAGQVIANQVGQQQRDSGLVTWNQLQQTQWLETMAKPSTNFLTVPW